MAGLEVTPSGKALWLHAGSPMKFMSLDHGQVCVNHGAWQGHYATYPNSALEKQCLILTFSGRHNRGHHFEEQVPHHLKPLGKHVYRNYDHQQILVFENLDYPVNVSCDPLARFGSVSTHYGNFHCEQEFVYCHPSKPEESLRLGWHEVAHQFIPKVSFNGREPTGGWSLHEFPSCHEAPSGIDHSRNVLNVTFHYNGDSSKEMSTVYGVVAGTTDVYRAIGSTNSNGLTRIYYDAELSLMSTWHIVLVGVK